MNKPLKPILKWAGGKEQELKYITPAIPSNYDRYFEPFVGGGAVYFSIERDKKKIINDKSHELISVYESAAGHDETFFKVLDEISHNWQLIEHIVFNNAVELISIYTDYASNHATELQMRNRVSEFILSHSKEFNGMFTRQFNFDIENFVMEVSRNLCSKVIRMRKINKSLHFCK